MRLSTRENNINNNEANTRLHTSHALTPQASPFIHNEQGYPGDVGMTLPFGIIEGTLVSTTFGVHVHLNDKE